MRCKVHRVQSRPDGSPLSLPTLEGRPIPFRDFQAATSTEPVQFKVGDDVFEAAAKCPAHALLSIAAAAQEGAEASAVSASMDFLDTVLLPESQERFAARIRSAENPIDLATLSEVVRWLVEVYTGRPTEQPSPSPAGPSAPSPSSTTDSPPGAATS